MSAKKTHKIIPRWKTLAIDNGIKHIPKWKKDLLCIADDLCYRMTDKDINFILTEEATEIQVENILHRYRLA